LILPQRTGTINGHFFHKSPIPFSIDGENDFHLKGRDIHFFSRKSEKKKRQWVASGEDRG